MRDLGAKPITRGLVAVALVSLSFGCKRSPDLPLIPPPESGAVEQRAPARQPERWMLGCYSLEQPRALALWRGEPTTITLTGQPAHPGPDAFEVRATNAGVRFSKWRPLSDSTVEIILGTGVATTVYRVKRASDGLAGTGVAYGDVGGRGTDPLPVTFRRVPCPSVSP